MKTVYISITGLRLKAPWHAPLFWYHATRSMSAAQSDPNCLSASARTIKGVHHTLTVWKNRQAMVKFLLGPAHRAAMKAFPTVGTGKTFGFEAEHAPDWPEARKLWEEKSDDVT